MARKVFISILGAGLYGKCKYIDDDFSSQNTFFVQTATLEYLNVKQWSKDDLGLFLLTDLAQKSNWDKKITQRRNNAIQQDIVYKGLEKDIEELELPIQIVPLSIPDGNNEQEIWEIFTKTFNELRNGDELYFDVTHAFRFLPMLILVLCNYAKFLKKVTVKSITYGNYEARNKTVEPNEAPIINLLPLTKLQDWTYAAGTYLDSGNVDRLVELSNQELSPILREAQGKNTDANNLRNFVKYLNSVIKERQTCRGLSIIKSDNFKKLKETADSLYENAILKPLNPVIDKIKDSFSDFDTDNNIRNGFAAAKWCLQNKLYQQSATMLQEVVVSFFCSRHGIQIDNEEEREIVNQAFNLKANNQAENTGDNWKRVKPDNYAKLGDILSDEYFNNTVIVNGFRNLTEIRNDYNHSGMRSKQTPLQPDAIIKNIEKCFVSFNQLFNPCS